MSGGVCASLGFVSAGCNRVSNGAQWCRHSDSGVVAYAAGPVVALYDPAVGCVFATLKGHGGRVNTLCWLHSGALLSGDSQGTVMVWDSSSSSSTSPHKWEAKEVHQEHNGKSVSFLACRTTVDGRFSVAASAGTDGSVVVYTSQGGELSLRVRQRLDFPNRMMECLDFALVGDSKVMMACGGVDCRVHLYECDLAAPEEAALFTLSGELRGHDDWIRCLRFAEPEEGDTLLLASASQDCRIRLWRMEPLPTEEAMDSGKRELEQGYTTDVILPTGWRVSLESVLPGHEEWVYSLDWHPSLRKPRDASAQYTDIDPSQAGRPVQFLLLSASMDRSMILWAPEQSSGLWLAVAQVGEFGGVAGLFGQLGYYGACFSPRGDQILAHGYNGSFHLWGFDSDSRRWQPQVTCSGHQGPVTDIMWDPCCDYLISTSLDQTSRLYATWVRPEMPRDALGDLMHKSWGVDGHFFDASRVALFHEMARPQIHGYDIRSLAPLSTKSFVSGSDEKLIRVFRAPKLVMESLRHLCDLSGSQERDAELRGGEEEEEEEEELAVGASVAALGLSNKAVQSGDLDEHGIMGPDGSSAGDGADWGEEIRFRALTLEQPPFEEHLLQSTLWPEIQKLYGHPDDIVCVAASHNGRFVAASCRAKSEKGAMVRIWDKERRWTQICALPGHKLTVTRLSFSPDDQLLVGVSKDRRISLFEQIPATDEQSSAAFRVAKVVDSKHTRIIWDCSWSATGDSLVTVSRDKKVKVWQVTRSPEVDLTLVWASRQLPQGPVTAVACCPLSDLLGFRNVFAVGFESGEIALLGASASTGDYECIYEFDSFITHAAQVRRLTWRSPHRTALSMALWKDAEPGAQFLELASCAEDHTARVFRLCITP